MTATLTSFENALTVCVCCLRGENLRNMYENLKIDGVFENYFAVINRCFNSQVIDLRISPKCCNICENCTQRLMDTYFFRNQIVKSQEALRLAVSKVSDCKELRKEFIEYSEHASNVNLDNSFGIYSEKQLIQEMALLLKKRAELLTKTNCEEIPKSKDVFIYNTNGKLNKMTEYQREAAISASMDTQNRQCLICKETFQNNHLLSIHTNVHFMRYTCHICGRSAATKSRLTRHSLMHKTGTFKCPDCDQVFDKASRLNAHRNIKHKGPNRVCPHCKMRFRSSYTRQAHIRDQHIDAFVPHKCTLCEYTTVSAWALTKHVGANHARRERAHACCVCDQKFYSESVLNTHMACHSAERPFGCTLCHRAFTRKKTLIQHMKVHKKLHIQNIL